MITDLAQAIKRCSKPETVALLVVRDANNKRINIMPIGWKMWTSAKPRMLAFSLSQGHYSHYLLLQERECVLAWPSRDMLEGILTCGSVTGRSTDKLALTGWKTSPAHFVNAHLIDDCIVNLECRVTESFETGDHTLMICEVLEGHLGNDESRVIFTLTDEAHFNHIGHGKGYKFGTFQK